MRKIKDFYNLLKHSNYTTKVKIYFAIPVAGDDYDSYEQNYTYSNLNPITIKAYVSQISPEALVWKQYGLKEIGAVEIITEKRYKNYFEKCNKIEIDDEEYEVFKEAVGNRSIISERPYNLIRVILNKKT